METKVQHESVRERESERLLQEQPQPRTRKSTDHFLQQASDPLTREPNRWKPLVAPVFNRWENEDN